MKDEYDFSGAKRGGFHRAGAVLVHHCISIGRCWLPFRSGKSTRRFPERARGNALLKKDIELIEAASTTTEPASRKSQQQPSASGSIRPCSDAQRPGRNGGDRARGWRPASLCSGLAHQLGAVGVGGG